MAVQYVPLLQIARELYRMPRDMTRFQEYLRTISAPDGNDVSLPPLVAMNPMAREHVPKLLDDYLQLDADAIAKAALCEAEPTLGSLTDEYKLGLVLLDDLKGGWTNRPMYELHFRAAWHSRDNEAARRRGLWLTAPLWSSEAASERTVRESVLLTVYRAEYQKAHGPQRDLASVLAQEGACMSHAGCSLPFEEDELVYTGAIIEPYLLSTDVPTAVACLFGDAAAESLGFAKMGLSSYAGLAWAMHCEQIRQCEQF